MNRVILMGRLTRDPEVRYSQGERSMAIARYTLAVDRRGRRSQDGDQGQTADFINIVAFDRAGEFAEKYFRQGMRVLVSGRIQTGSYGGGNRGGYQQGTRPAPSSAIGDGFMNIPDGVEDEGLPFN